MDNNVESALDLLRFLNGKEIEVSIKELVYVVHVVKIKIYVKYVHQIYNLDYLWKSEIKGVDKMANIQLIKILLIKKAKRLNLHHQVVPRQFLKIFIKKNKLCIFPNNNKVRMKK